MNDDKNVNDVEEAPVQTERERLVALRLKARQERLAAALRENLRKRKAQKKAGAEAL